ncbi:RnlA [Aeromonas phage phiAS5]|uniref:RNA ligase 1 n=1 Tax=Aeromonas phage phiAS5 TaxID=879630 RepID=E1A2J4_9CAUD|nr:RNA ligase and tail fiber protein attachment catalyst [Aeromonas phage phiAS5]ADM79940.1 RnlA [Aeromonas phage phiAS5]BES53289.1 hypothetical protein [Aeromonas phage phiWae14]
MQSIKELYQNLVNLCVDDNTKFFFSETVTSLGTKVRIFDYHVAGYNDWIRPDAMACRGIMFEMNGEIPVRIMSRPMDKFFNYSEVIGWEKLETHGNMKMPDLSKIKFVIDKRDGSLISTFMDVDNLLLKSKGSIRSNQANDASVWLYQDDQADLLEFCRAYAKEGFTVNMEWTAPHNQIVLCYTDHQLRILNIRHNETGEYVDFAELQKDSVFRKYAADFYEVPQDGAEWIKNVYGMTGIEGYVVVMEDYQMFKLKTDWYVALHHTKDSINDSKRLISACAENATDDLRQMFRDDPNSLAKIEVFDAKFRDVVSSAMQALTNAYSKYKALERREYAISMTNEFKNERHWFNIAMQMFSTRPDFSLADEIVAVIKKYPEKFVPQGY